MEVFDHLPAKARNGIDSQKRPHEYGKYQLRNLFPASFPNPLPRKNIEQAKLLDANLQFITDEKILALLVQQERA